jgi:hypothetical protein
MAGIAGQPPTRERIRTSRQPLDTCRWIDFTGADA